MFCFDYSQKYTSDCKIKHVDKKRKNFFYSKNITANRKAGRTVLKLRDSVCKSRLI